MPQTPCPSCGAPHLDDVLAELERIRARLDVLEGQPRRPSSPATELTFLRFWSLYPRKAGKMDAARAWAQLRLADRSAALDAVARYSEIWASASEDRKTYIPYPSTWIRHRRWEDGAEEWERAAGHNRSQAPTVAPRALVGQNRTPDPTRDVDERSPEWVKETARALASPLRPEIPDDLVSAYVEWRQGKSVLPPPGWSGKLLAGWQTVRDEGAKK